MMTNPELLLKLQAAWHQAAAVIAVGQEPERPPRCQQHNNRSSWQDEKVRDYRGWIRTTCKQCGGFVGYRFDDS
jgi:hypothetical protein